MKGLMIILFGFALAVTMLVGPFIYLESTKAYKFRIGTEDYSPKNYCSEVYLSDTTLIAKDCGLFGDNYELLNASNIEIVNLTK